MDFFENQNKNRKLNRRACIECHTLEHIFFISAQTHPDWRYHIIRIKAHHTFETNRKMFSAAYAVSYQIEKFFASSLCVLTAASNSQCSMLSKYKYQIDWFCSNLFLYSRQTETAWSLHAPKWIYANNLERKCVM